MHWIDRFAAPFNGPGVLKCGRSFFPNVGDSDCSKTHEQWVLELWGKHCCPISGQRVCRRGRFMGMGVRGDAGARVRIGIRNMVRVTYGQLVTPSGIYSR